MNKVSNAEEMVDLIYSFLKDNDEQGLVYIKKRKELAILADRFKDDTGMKTIDTVKKAEYWFSMPVQVRIQKMTWYQNGKINRPGILAFELFNRMIHQPEGWNDPNYPPPHKITKSLYGELVEELRKVGFHFERGCNDAISIYKIGRRYDTNITEQKWEELVTLFVTTIKSVGHDVNLIFR